MNCLAISLVIVLATECAADFYSQPGHRFYYSYHPFRARRSVSVNASSLEPEQQQAENTTVVSQPSSNATATSNTSLPIQTPVVNNTLVDENEQRSNLYFSIAGDGITTVHCSYNYTGAYVACQGLAGTLVCNSSVDYSHLDQLSFDVISFGLRRMYYDVFTTMAKYRIFPFRLVSREPALVYEYRQLVYGKPIVSFMNSTSREAGTKYDLVCFNQLIGLLNQSNLLQQVQIVVNDVFHSIDDIFDIDY